MAVINNTKSNKLLSGTSGNYYIQNGGYWDDSWHNGGSNVTINTGEGNDSVENWYCEKVTINTGAGNDSVWNFSSSSVTINTGAGNDSIWSGGSSVTINAGAGNDSVFNSGGSSVTINTGAGNDDINNYGSEVTINTGKGNDSIYNNWDFSSNAPRANNSGSNVLFKYSSGDGNDIIYGFKANSTLSIGGGAYSTKKSGDNIIVTVGTGKISLIGAASMSKVNIKGTKATSTTKTVTNSTKSPVTVGSAIKTINASKRTTAVKITGNANANTITGGSGKDSIYGGTGNDSILGNAGNDKLYGQAGNDKLYGGKGNDTLSGGKGNDSLWGNAGKDTFIYANGDGKDVIFGFENTDMLKITGKFSTSYNKSKGEIYFKVGSTANAITLKDFSATSFNVNGTNYKISGSKLVKK